MAGNSGSKGNPASHRMGNKHLKEYRASCWSRQKKRKEARRKAEEERHKRNIQLRKEGKLTPWEQAKAERSRRRDVA